MIYPRILVAIKSYSWKILTPALSLTLLPVLQCVRQPLEYTYSAQSLAKSLHEPEKAVKRPSIHPSMLIGGNNEQRRSSIGMQSKISERSLRGYLCASSSSSEAKQGSMKLMAIRDWIHVSFLALTASLGSFLYGYSVGYVLEAENKSYIVYNLWLSYLIN